MAQNYQKIGDYISVVDNRNTDGSITNLMGISIDKCYIPSVANVIGTDLHNYKVIRKGQFACSLMQVSRDQRIPLAMYTSDEPAIMSPAYVMFEVSRPDELLPEYLELWFKRAEFDREASFYAVGGVRGSLDWEDFRKMKLPVPSLPEQRKIVHDYQVITDRIELLRKMNETLDAIAYTCYKEMLLSEDKSKWHTGTLRELLTVKYGKDHSALADGPFPLYGSGGLMRFVERPLYDKVSVLIPRKGSLNNIMYVDEPFWSVDTMFYTEIANPKAAKFVYFFLRDIDFLGLNTGSAVPSTSSDVIHNMQLEVPPDKDLEKFDDIVTPLFAQIKANNNERDKLKALRVLVSSIVTKGA